MRTLEEKFGKPHPALEGFKEPPRSLMWLAQAYFRLHRRRQLADSGYQPLPYQEMAQFARHVLHLDTELEPLYFRAMEEADNAVLYDHYSSQKAALDNPPKGKTKPKP
jgi:uncharacterized protein YecE (DUF72 family)